MTEFIAKKVVAKVLYMCMQLPHPFSWHLYVWKFKRSLSQGEDIAQWRKHTQIHGEQITHVIKLF